MFIPRAASESSTRLGRFTRRGAAAVEFAVIAPFLATTLLGMMEIGRGLIVKEVLSDAAQKACRTAALPGKANSDATTEVANIMSDNSITGYSTTIQVNGVTADVSTANRFDKISVKVSIPVSQALWTTAFFLTTQMVESETVVMMRQG